MTDYEFLMVSPAELGKQFSGNIPANQKLLRTRFGLQKSGKILSFSKTPFGVAITFDLFSGSPTKIILDSCRSLKYSQRSVFKDYRTCIYKESFPRFNVGVIPGYLEYYIPDSFIGKTQRNIKIGDILGKLQNHRRKIQSSLDIVSEWFRSGEFFDAWKEEAPGMKYSVSQPILSFQGAVNLHYNLTSCGIPVDSSGLIRIALRVNKNISQNGLWESQIYRMCKGYMGSLEFDPTTDLGELQIWIKTPRDTKKLEAIESANREFSVAIEGARRWISEKYGVPESLISEIYYDKQKDKLNYERLNDV